MSPSTPAPSLRAERNASEAGSAYLAVLLVLVVLTILGLSLAVVTQTEVIIGGSEKQATRQTYGANSAIEMATGTEMVSAGSAAHQFILAERTERILGTDTTISDLICTSPYVQIHTSICNLCMMNQDAEYSAVQYGVTAVALRRDGTGAGGFRASSKAVGAVIALEPWKKSISGFQFSSADRLQTPADPTIDVDPNTETDPCEGLYLKI